MGIKYCVCNFSLPEFFLVLCGKKLKGDGGARNAACVHEEFFVKYVLDFSKMVGVLYSFGPFIIMGLTNIAIIFKFIQAKMVSKHGGTESTNQALGNAAMRGTAILITVTMTFIILTAPAQITFSITSNIHPLLEPFLYISLALNHSINGFLYMIVGSKFRKELVDTLCCNSSSHVPGNDSGITKSTGLSING